MTEFLNLPLRRIIARAEDKPAPSGAWPYNLAITRRALDGLDFGALTVITGENGAGKSTLVESIAEAYGLPLGGGDAQVARPGYENSSAFGFALQVVRGAARRRAGLFLRAEGLLAHLEYLAELQSDRAKKMLRLSHGESTQRFLEYAQENYGLWILDEPESGLSLNGQLQLLARILDFLQSGGQVILCTHSPLLASLADFRDEQVWEIGEWGLRLRSWRELEMVRDWQAILQEPGYYLRYLAES
ncbi:AAA family ATPase [Rothia sp. CCM 9417]|uniref:AAA family ATPase n=1 Tax=Rothia sp. CCM 9417 TaxID=3402657 RepID=UPI003ADE1A14